MEYHIRRTTTISDLDGDWENLAWQHAHVAEIANFRPESSAHRPRARARVLYDEQALYGGFVVEDCFVRCVHEGFQAAVCRDSCVEFFFKPHVGPGYFNFEFNCGGAFLAYYVLDCRRVGDEGLAHVEPLSVEQCRQVKVWHSLPSRIEPEIATPVQWTVQFAIPLAILEDYTGPFDGLKGKQWTGNFYKCGDETSHPHWASWVPVDELNFHLPQCFQTLNFA